MNMRRHDSLVISVGLALGRNKNYRQKFELTMHL